MSEPHGARVVDWERGIGEAEVPSAPVRSIAITPEVLAEEAAKQRARDAELALTPWAAFKATLSADNLRRGRVQVSPGRFHTVIVAEKDAKPASRARNPRGWQPKCECGAIVSKGSKRCHACYLAARQANKPVQEERACEDCGTALAKGTRVGVKHCRTCRYKHTKPHAGHFGKGSAADPAAKDVAQSSTKRRCMKPPAKFTLLSPVHIDDAPQAFTLKGRNSPYLSLYQSLGKLAKTSFQPVEVENTKSGYAIAASLRKMAGKDGKAVEQRTSDDRLTFFFRLTEKAPEQAAETK